MPTKRKTTTMKKSSGLPHTSNARNQFSRTIDDEDTDIEVEDFQCEESVFEVERVIGKMYDDRGDISYNIKWKGYDEPSWEKKENCSCDQLIDRYESFLARRYGRSGPDIDEVGGSPSPNVSVISSNNNRRSNGIPEVTRRSSGRFK